MPTTQNRTRNAVAVTCSDSRFISDFWRELGLREPMRFPRLSLSSARIRSLISCPVPKIWRKTRHLTNDGMLKILCLDVEELLDDTWSNSLNDVFANCKRRSTCP